MPILFGCPIYMYAASIGALIALINLNRIMHFLEMRWRCGVNYYDKGECHESE